MDQVEPEPEPTELPPVAAEVDRKARQLAETVWYNGPLERKQLPLGQDEALSVAREWLTAPGELVTRGLVDPRPVSVTHIPALCIPLDHASGGGSIGKATIWSLIRASTAKQIAAKSVHQSRWSRPRGRKLAGSIGG